MQVEGICKLCGESAILQKSHLLPRALFPKVADEKGKVVVIHRDIGASYPPGMGHIKRNLLCQKCENFRYVQINTNNASVWKIKRYMVILLNFKGRMEMDDSE